MAKFIYPVTLIWALFPYKEGDPFPETEILPTTYGIFPTLKDAVNVVETDQVTENTVDLFNFVVIEKVKLGYPTESVDVKWFKWIYGIDLGFSWLECSKPKELSIIKHWLIYEKETNALLGKV